MRVVKEKFSLLLNVILKIVLAIITVFSIGTFFAAVLGFNIGTIVITLIEAVALYLGYKIIKKDTSDINKVIAIIGMGIIIRILWMLNANTMPSSDFKTMYAAAASLLNGDTTIYKGVGYIGRYPHLVVTSLYMALFQYILPSANMLAMKIANLVFGIIVLYLIYKITQEVFEDEKKSKISLLIAAIFPPLVTYTPVFCSENIAMPFYLLSIYLFIKGIKNEKFRYFNFIGSGLFLSLGNLFRMVAMIIVIAYVIYFIIYFKAKILDKLISIGTFIIPYLLVLVIASSLIQSANVTEGPLWKGSEPKITSALKGVNVKAVGRWNEEDAGIIDEYLYDYDVLNDKCKEIIIDRLTSTSPITLFSFYVQKLCTQWNMGDFSGGFWSQTGLNEDEIIFRVNDIGSMALQIVFVVVLILIYLGLFDKKNRDNSLLNLFYLILCGYIGAYLLMENQSRYAYIISWVFVILAIAGLDRGKQLLIKIKNKRA